MFDQQLTTEQIEFRDTVRDFVRREVKPVVLHPERLQAVPRRIPLELIDLASQLGLRALELSEAAGGAGSDSLTACIVLEELGAGDVDLAATLAETSRLARLLFDSAMSGAQRAKFLPAFLADDRYHLACACFEPDAELGWAYNRPGPLSRDVDLHAVRRADEWVVNGTASFVANAPLAKLFAVCVRAAGSSATLLVPRDTPGFEVGDHGDAAGAGVRWYHGTRGALVFSNCRVPVEHTLGEDGHAKVIAGQDAGGHGGPQMQAVNLGVGRAACEAAIEYARLRVQGARTIVGHQAIGTILADVAIRLEVARSIVWRAAWAADHPERYRAGSECALPLQTIAKVYTSEAVHEAAERAAECFGAMGVMRDMPLHKYVHDALVFIDSGTSNTVARFRIAEALTGYERGAGAARVEAQAA